MTTARVTSKGQTTIPKQIRQLLNLQPGDQINFVVEGDRVYLEPKTIPVESLSSKYQYLVNRPVSLEEIDEAIATAIVEARVQRNEN